MALETEVKLKVESHDPVRDTLRELGAERLGAVLERNVILDSRDGSLRSGGCGLRVRTATNADDGASVVTLTYKGPVQPGPMKKREEIEVVVADADTMLQMLDRLGYQMILEFEKRRESWSYGGCRVELDEPPHIGLFVEIEGPDEQAIRQVQSQIGLSQLPHVRASYIRMLHEFCRERRVGSRVLRLT